MKKIIATLCVLAALFMLVGCAGAKEEKITDHYYEINYKRLVEISKEDDSKPYLIYVYSNSCSYCKAYKPKLKEVSEEQDVIVYALNKDDLSEKESEKIGEDYIPGFDGGVPLTVTIKNGELVKMTSELVGQTQKDMLVGNASEGAIRKFIGETCK